MTTSSSSSSGEQQTMYHRRATSLGKGQLRTAGGNALAAARLARTSSWSNGLDNNNSSVIPVPQQQVRINPFTTCHELVEKRGLE